MEGQTAVQLGGGGNASVAQQAGNASGAEGLTPINNGATLLVSYLCPSRGPRGNGLTDYGYLQQNGVVIYNAPLGVSAGKISNSNGCSKTALVSHIGCNPLDYAIGPTPWYNCLQPFSGQSVDDSEVPPGQYCTNFSSPHPGGNVVLFADGHVQFIDHDWLTANQAIWYWQNATTTITLPN
jgi:prepilin-type processing-associated H-X9-DG protein